MQPSRHRANHVLQTRLLPYLSKFPVTPVQMVKSQKKVAHRVIYARRGKRERQRVQIVQLVNFVQVVRVMELLVLHVR